MTEVNKQIKASAAGLIEMEPSSYITMYKGTSGSKSDPQTLEIPDNMYPAKIIVSTSIIAHHAGSLGGSVQLYKKESEDPFYSKSYSRSSAYQSASVSYTPTDDYEQDELMTVNKAVITASGSASSIGGSPGEYSYSKVTLYCKYKPWWDE